MDRLDHGATFDIDGGHQLVEGGYGRVHGSVA
jgi:hypothetical protein